MRPSIIKPLITEGLGYCCPYIFLFIYSKHGDNQLIADRLGVDPRTVRRLRGKFYDCEISCEKKEGCMKALEGIREKRLLHKQPNPPRDSGNPKVELKK